MMELEKHSGRHAYLIMAYNNWRQLRMLVELLDDGRNDIFIHVDKRAGEFPREEIASAARFSGLTFIPRKNVYWADYSQTDVELDLLEAASRKEAYHYYHLLSGMCLPLKNQDELHRFFDGQDKEFISMVRDGGAYTHEHAGYYHLLLHNPVFRSCKALKAVNMALVYGQKLIGVDRLRKNNMIMSTGWTWFSITHRFCRHMVEHRELIEKTFRHTQASDEMVMGTMVVNFGLEDSVYDINNGEKNDYVPGGKRLIDWNRGKPYTWGASTPEEDFRTLMDSDCLFARKFDERVNFELIQRIYDALKRKE